MEGSRARSAVSCIFLINGAIMGTWIARLPAFQDRFHIGPGLLSTALLCCALGAVVGMPAAGRLCARFGSRPVIVSTTLALCLVLPLLPVAPTFAGFSLVLFMMGLLSGVMDVNMNAHAVLVERLYGRPIMSSFHGFFSAGAMLGGLIGSLAAKLLLVPAIHLPLVAAVLFILAIGARSHLLPAEMDKHRPPNIQTEGNHQGTPPQLGKHFFRPQLVIVALSSMALCSFVMEGSVGDWSAVYMHSVLNTSESFAALGFASFNVAMTVGRFCGDNVVLKIGPVATIRFGALLAVLGLSGALAGNNSIVSLIGFAAVGIGLATIVPNVFSAAGNAADNAGKGIATVAVAGYAGLLAGPPVIGFTAELTNLRFALSIVCFLGLIVMVLAGYARPVKVTNRAV
jgi:fucose permease